MNPNEVSDHNAKRVTDAIDAVYGQLKFDGRPEDVRLVINQLFGKNSSSIDDSISVSKVKSFLNRPVSEFFKIMEHSSWQVRERTADILVDCLDVPDSVSDFDLKEAKDAVVEILSTENLVAFFEPLVDKGTTVMQWLRDDFLSDLWWSDDAETVKENKKFDYKQYLTEGWLFQEAKAPQQKDLYKNRADRASKGNWKGSIGKYVETHGEELRSAFESGNLRHYVQTRMKSALESEEDREYLEDIEVSSKTDMRLYTALYNIALKGAGLGGEKAHGINVSSKK